MADHADDSPGSEHAPRRKKTGRQEVRRHFRPSVGRWVETYDRRGEHARPGQKAAGPAEPPSAPDDTPAVTPPARSRRLLLIAAGAVLLIGLAAVTIATRAGRGPRPIDYEILAARAPVIVKLAAGRGGDLAEASPHQLDQARRAAVAAVRSAAAAHPGLLVVIDPASAPISFNGLPAAERTRLQREHGPDAAAVYESVVAAFLEGVLGAAGDLRIGVLGLPVETGEAGDAAHLTNHRYRRVIGRLGEFVSAHIFFRTATTLSEKQMVLEAIPEALRRRGTRPVVFRQNLDWRVLVDRDSLDDPARAPWEGLVAEAGR